MPTTARSTTGNLPPELTSFVGRGREIGEVKDLLSESRLVTLIGVGGAGKTRLAQRVAADLGWAFDGVWFVDLTHLQDQGLLTLELHDPDVLAYLVGATLRLRDLGGEPLERLVEQLADRRMLLVLDNCEHLLPASADFAHALLRGCPELRVLATSRDPLLIGGETVFPVPPLAAPEPGQRWSLAEMNRCESVALFLARAQATTGTDFQLTSDNHVAVGELCHRLDGLPLAIELAAARTRALAPEQILERLTDRFALLSRGSRAAPARQQTLRACVDWSFDLCAKPERQLWARLSVFAGTFELDAVEGICAGEDLPERELLELVAGLVDKSILVRDDRDDVNDPHHLVRSARYRMLETIRDYGQEKLVEDGEGAALLRRHRDWHQTLAARARTEWISDRQPYWMARLCREHANLRAAVEYSLTEPDEAEAALRLAVTLPRLYWRARGVFGEGRRWLDRALAQATAPTAVRAQALLVDSFLAFVQGDAAAASQRLEEGEELARHLGAAATLAYADNIRGVGALFANDLTVAVSNLGRAWTTLSAAPDLDLDLYLYVLTAYGVAAGLAGDHERASACQQEMLAIVESRGGGGLHQSTALWMAGLLAWLRGDLSEAVAQVVACLRLERGWDSDDRYGTALCLEVLAWTTADERRHRRAATLLGAADNLWTDLQIPITSHRHLIHHHEACERQTRDALDDAAYDRAFHHGQALTYDDAIAYALDEPRQPAPSPSSQLDPLLPFSARMERSNSAG